MSDDIDTWLRPVKGLVGFPSPADIALGENVRHMRNVHDVRVFGRVLDALVEALGRASRAEMGAVRECLERVVDLLAEMRVEREVPAFRRTLDSTLALIDGGKLGARAAESLGARTGCAVSSFDAAAEVAITLCIDEALAVKAEEWAVRKIQRRASL